MRNKFPDVFVTKSDKSVEDLNEKIEDAIKRYKTNNDMTAYMELGEYLYNEKLINYLHNKLCSEVSIQDFVSDYGEAVTGLIHDFDPEANDSFMSYFWMYIQRRFVSERKKSCNSEIEILGKTISGVDKKIKKRKKANKATTDAENEKKLLQSQVFVGLDVEVGDDGTTAGDLLSGNDHEKSESEIFMVLSLETMTNFINMYKSMGSERKEFFKREKAIKYFPEIHVDIVKTELGLLDHYQLLYKHEKEFFKAFNCDFIDYIMEEDGCRDMDSLRNKSSGFDTPLKISHYVGFYKGTPKQTYQKAMESHRMKYLDFIHDPDEARLAIGS